MNGGKLRLLLVEDNPGDARLVCELLRGEPFQIEEVERLSAALDRLRRDPPELVLLDLGLPDSQGLDTVSAVTRAAPGVAVVVLTSHEDEALGLAAVRAGGEDFLSKNAVSAPLLGRVLRYALERCRAGERVRESHDFVRATMDSLSAHLCVLDAEGVIVAVNQAWRAFALANPPISTNVLEGASYLAVCDAAKHPDLETARAFAEGIRSVLRGAAPGFELEYPCHVPNGEQRWFLGRVTRFAGHSERVVVAHETITARRLAEERLLASEARLARAQRIAGLGHWEWNLRGEKLLWSEEIYRLFGLPRDAELSFESIVARIHPEDRPRNRAFVERLLGGIDHGDLELRVLTPEGEVRHLQQHAEVQRGPEGQLAIHGTMQDISALKQAEEETRASETRFRTIFDEVTDGILLADLATRRIVMANRSLCRMLGRTEEALLALGLEDIHPTEDLPAVFAAIEQGDRPLASEVRMLRTDGSVFFVDVSAVPITLDRRQLVMGSYRDATERRALQASLAQQDRLASMGLLAAGVAHEINNPLTYVLYSLQTLDEELPAVLEAIRRCKAAVEHELGDRLPSGHETFDPAGLEEAVARVRDALEGAHRIREIAKALSTFSRVERVELGPVDLHRAIEHAITMATNEIKHRARVTLELGHVPLLHASQGKLAQVFLNLLINAAQSITEGDVETNSIRIRTWCEGETVLAEVADTGHGIAPEHRDRVFEPFFSTKEIGVGSGLGLAICKEIVEGFGGRIALESELGVGTRFQLSFPISRAETPAERPALAAPASPSARGRILVVDDEAAVRKTFVRMLRDHEVVLAASGEEAKELLAVDDRFDLVFCDLMMPRLSGMDLHGWLAGAYPELASGMVFITGGAFTPRAREFMAAVPNLLLEKPLESRIVIGTVNAVVTARRSAAKDGS